MVMRAACTGYRKSGDRVGKSNWQLWGYKWPCLLCTLTALALVILLVGSCDSCNCGLCCHSQLVFPSAAFPGGWPAWANTERDVMYGSRPDQALPLQGAPSSRVELSHPSGCRETNRHSRFDYDRSWRGDVTFHSHIQTQAKLRLQTNLLNTRTRWILEWKL